MKSADIVVIGRGLMGSACAAHLARAGCDTVLVGQDEPADPTTHQGPFGSFHDAGRISRTIADDPVWARLALWSIARYADLQRQTGIVFFTPRATVMAGPATGKMAGFTQGFLSCAAGLGLAHRRLEGAALAAAYPCFQLPDGTIATVDPSGGVIDPRAMRQAHEAVATAAGARVIKDSVTARDGGRLQLASGAVVHADHVVFAMGGWAGFAPYDGPRLAMRVYQRSVALVAVQGDQAKELAAMPNLIFVPGDRLTDLYLLPPVRYPDGRSYLKIGGEHDSPLASDAAALNAWFRGTGSAAAGAALLAQLRAVMPGLVIDKPHGAACAVSFTATGYPYIGRIDAGTTVLTGGNGAAAKCADALGRLGAIAALGGDLAAEGFGTDFAPCFA